MVGFERSNTNSDTVEPHQPDTCFGSNRLSDDAVVPAVSNAF